jgi:hypothetical protein
MRLEVVVTQRCDAICRWCNRLVGVAKIDDSDMTAEQAKRAVDAIKAQRRNFTLVTLAGGEPAENPELQGIAEEFASLPSVRGIRVLTNDENKDRVAALKPKMPGKCAWVHAPLAEKHHVPFLVSPVDTGMEEYVHPEQCSVMAYCGRGLDAHGFSSCGVMGSLARLLRINPYSKEPQIHAIDSICRHCPYSIAGGKDKRERTKQRRRQKKLYERCMSGEIRQPTPTFREGLRQHREEPMVFARF